MFLTKMWATQDIAPMPQRDYVKNWSSLNMVMWPLILKYSNQYLDCFILFSQFQVQKWGVLIIYTTLEKYERGPFKISFRIALTYTWENLRLTIN